MTLPTAEEIEAESQQISRRANDRIKTEGPNWHSAEYRARAEMVASEEIPDEWDWEVVESLGSLPFIALMRFDPRKLVGKSVSHGGKSGHAGK